VAQRCHKFCPQARERLKSPSGAAQKRFLPAATQQKLPFVGPDTGVSDNFVTSG
jgi:hypothetical protein